MAWSEDSFAHPMLEPVYGRLGGTPQADEAGSPLSVVGWSVHVCAEVSCPRCCEAGRPKTASELFRESDDPAADADRVDPLGIFSQLLFDGDCSTVDRFAPSVFYGGSIAAFNNTLYAGVDETDTVYVTWALPTEVVVFRSMVPVGAVPLEDLRWEEVARVSQPFHAYDEPDALVQPTLVAGGIGEVSVVGTSAAGVFEIHFSGAHGSGVSLGQLSILRRTTEYTRFREACLRRTADGTLHVAFVVDAASALVGGIYHARRDPGSRRWTTPTGPWNATGSEGALPTLAVDGLAGELTLAWREPFTQPPLYDQTWLRTSSDGGVTWSDAQQVSYPSPLTGPIAEDTSTLQVTTIYPRGIPWDVPTPYVEAVSGLLDPCAWHGPDGRLLLGNHGGPDVNACWVAEGEASASVSTPIGWLADSSFPSPAYVNPRFVHLSADDLNAFAMWQGRQREKTGMAGIWGSVGAVDTASTPVTGATLGSLAWFASEAELSGIFDRLDVQGRIAGTIRSSVPGSASYVVDTTRGDLEAWVEVADNLLITSGDAEGRYEVTGVESSSLTVKWMGDEGAAPDLAVVTKTGPTSFQDEAIIRGPYLDFPSGFIDSKGRVHLFWFEAPKTIAHIQGSDEVSLCYRLGQVGNVLGEGLGVGRAVFYERVPTRGGYRA